MGFHPAVGAVGVQLFAPRSSSPSLSEVAEAAEALPSSGSVAATCSGCIGAISPAIKRVRDRVWGSGSRLHCVRYKDSEFGGSGNAGVWFRAIKM
jgi:hypothetical protein